MKLLASLLPLLATVATFQTPIQKYFHKINNELVNFNAAAAELTWKSIAGVEGTRRNVSILNEQWMRWHAKSCNDLAMMGGNLNSTERRQAYLLCRQPILKGDEARVYETLYNDLQSAYSNTEICIPTENPTQKRTLTEISRAIIEYVNSVKTATTQKNIDTVLLAVKQSKETKTGICLKGESEFNDVLLKSDDEVVTKFVWLAWREKFGTIMEAYKMLVDVKNGASRRVGFHDLGAAWREELEIPNLREYSRKLYEDIKPLYKLLHGVVRYYLQKVYKGIDEYGSIPAHLLGDLWSQDWSSLSHLFTPAKISIDEGISYLKWNITYMAKRAEDFYQSLGLPEMTRSFWRKSIFDANSINCHGTAADMFRPGDFRAIICQNTPPTASDLYVLHHEMGHIQYYMAYEHQPGIFRQGANSAFHESIGDTIMLGVNTPQHLNRLGLLNDTMLYTTSINIAGVTTSTDLLILLKTALQTIPQIPFSLLIDEYRWGLFEGGMKEGMNRKFWELAEELQGIVPPVERGEEYFDAAAKYHVLDDTPYIRYFLSYFVQYQLFDELCRVAVYGHRGIKEDVPDSIPLHRCDIYGSKAVGKLLKDFMSRGSSRKWQESLYKTTGKSIISADSIIKYFKPLQNILETLVEINHIPLGW